MVTTASQRATLTMVWRPTASPAARVYAFPHAGAGAAALRPLAVAAPDWLEVVAIRLPGREGRLPEPPPQSLAEVADAVADAVAAAGHGRCPTFWFGACSGAVLAFEQARRMGGSACGAGLVVTSRPAPSAVLTGPVADDDEAVIGELRTLGGVSPDLLASREALDLLLPAVKADKRLVEGYRRPARAELDLPVLALRGTEDPVVSSDGMRGWAQHTSQPVDVAEVAGGHFLLRSSPDPVMAAVAAFAGSVAGASR